MDRNARMINSGETFRARYDEPGAALTPQSDDLKVQERNNMRMRLGELDKSSKPAKIKHNRKPRKGRKGKG